MESVGMNFSGGIQCSKKPADGGFYIRDIIAKTATNGAAILGRPKIGRVFLLHWIPPEKFIPTF